MENPFSNDKEAIIGGLGMEPEKELVHCSLGDGLLLVREKKEEDLKGDGTCLGGWDPLCVTRERTTTCWK